MASQSHVPQAKESSSPAKAPDAQPREVAEAAVDPLWQQTSRNPLSLSAVDARKLQRSVGNTAVQRLIAQSTNQGETAHPQPQPARPQVSHGALALAIQRRLAYVAEAKAPVFQYDAQNTVLYNRVGNLDLNTRVDAADQPTYASPNSNKQEYTKLNNPIDGVIKEAHLRANAKNRSGMWDVVETESQVMGEVAGLYDLRAGSLDRGSLRETDAHGYRVDKEGNTKTQDWQEKHSADVVSGSYETVANILSIANTLRQWKKHNRQERAGDVVDVVKSVASTGAAVTKMVDSGSKLDVNQAGGIGNTVTVGGGGRSSVTEGSGSFETTASDLAGKVTGNIADFVGIIQSVKDIFFKGKALFATWNKYKDEGTASRGDVVRSGVDLALTVVGAIKDVVSTARNLLFTLENAWHGGLAAAVPGLGIAIGALKLIVSIWKVVRANKERAKMRKIKQEWKEKLRGEDQFDAFEKIDNKKIAARKKALLKSLDRAQSQGFASTVSSIQTKLALIEEYELQKELQTVNEKRIKRQAVHITSGILSISGDIATLSGVGAHAGVGLKAASAATELGAVGLRKAKQYGRDRASKEGAWNITKKVFNAEKNSKAKLAQRERFADMIYDKVIALSEKSSQFEDGKIPYNQPEFQGIRMYIRAVGLSWKAWLNQTSADPAEGHNALVQGLAERE
jgi:hypothetical protein